jgi:hypothetical protein
MLWGSIIHKINTEEPIPENTSVKLKTNEKNHESSQMGKKFKPEI